MNGWDALQAYEIANNGGGNYHFIYDGGSGKLDRNPPLREGAKTIWAILKLEREAKKLGLDKP